MAEGISESFERQPRKINRKFSPSCIHSAPWRQPIESFLNLYLAIPVDLSIETIDFNRRALFSLRFRLAWPKRNEKKNRPLPLAQQFYFNLTLSSNFVTTLSITIEVYIFYSTNPSQRDPLNDPSHGQPIRSGKNN